MHEALSYRHCATSACGLTSQALTSVRADGSKATSRATIACGDKAQTLTSARAGVVAVDFRCIREP